MEIIFLKFINIKNMYKYRFKTEKEFIKDYGKNFRGIQINNSRYTWITQMDYLFGREYPFFIDNNCIETQDDVLLHRYGDYPHNWYICWFMLTEKIKTPNYIPKKLIF